MDFDAKLKQIQTVSQKNFGCLTLTTEFISLALPFCSHFSDFSDWVCRTPRVLLRRKQLLQREMSESALCCWS